MFTWGYIKEATLQKLDMDANAAIEMGLLNKFPYYANEALVQIAGAVKAKRTHAYFKVIKKNKLLKIINHNWGPFDDLGFLFVNKCKYEDLTDNEQAAYTVYHEYVFVSEPVKMPKDFLSFADDVNRVNENDEWEEAHDDDFSTFGGNEILFKSEGLYYVSYHAVWDTLTSTTDDDAVLDIPDDILISLPSYIASQCFKIDDEVKSQIYRNEYEMFVARIDENSYKTNKTVSITGGW